MIHGIRGQHIDPVSRQSNAGASGNLVPMRLWHLFVVILALGVIF